MPHRQSASHPFPHTEYRADIDGLRAIAVCSVVIFHAFPHVLSGGFVGVDIFFVISGYLIGKIILAGTSADTFSFTDFYKRRVKRIFPALMLVLVACYALGWLCLLPAEYKELSKHIASGAGFVSNFTLWGEAGYFDPAADTKPLLHLWSLGIEEQFYIVWPLFLWLCARFRIKALLPIILVGLVSFTINILTIQDHPIAGFYSPLSRFWELLIGSILAYQHLNGQSLFKSRQEHKSLFGAILIVIAIALLNSGSTFPGWWALLPTIGAYFIIDAGPTAWLNRRILSNQAFVWFGVISFPLYLWHWPLLSFLSITHSGNAAMELRAIAVIISIFLAWLTYRFVERPIRFGNYSHQKATVLCGLAISIGCIGLASYAAGGLPSRFPAEIRQIANYTYEFASDARATKCWLSAKQPYNGFNEACANESPGANSDSIVVWGDSHAARLYPGLAATLGDKVAISQFTRDACAPILNIGYAICEKNNDFVLSEIKRLRPKTVVMFAVWGSYQENWNKNSLISQGLLHTIRELKSSGVKEIIVLGPAPKWNAALPKLIYENWQYSYPFHRIADRLSTGIDHSAVIADKQLAVLLRPEPVRYSSLMDFLCTKNGCLTHVPNHPTELLTWDYGHLTTQGAILVSQHLAKDGLLP